jgi:hypothetical protein
MLAIVPNSPARARVELKRGAKAREGEKDGYVVKQASGWDFNCSTENEAKLKPLCLEVEKHFQLPAHRLYRYFARTDDLSLEGPPMRLGRHYRGFHAPLSDRIGLPKYLFDCFFHPLDNFPEPVPFEEMVAFDNLIFIRQSTCLDVTGCVTTYAHELQHFMQHGHTPRLAAVNSDLYCQLKPIEPTAVTTDVPHEREANIVSKRVAEAVCGVDAVRAFAEEQIRFMEQVGEPEQMARWVFFRDVPSAIRYDLLEATLPLVERYRTRIKFRVDVNEPGWWLGPLEKEDRRLVNCASAKRAAARY